MNFALPNAVAARYDSAIPNVPRLGYPTCRVRRRGNAAVLVMPEVRHDFLLPRWVIIAENRAERPNEFVSSRVERQTAACPFCPGNETQTPDAVLVRRPKDWNGDARQWRIRVVSNLYPAVDETPADGIPAERSAEFDVFPRRAKGDVFRAAPAEGFHEVVIDTPEHIASLGSMRDEDAIELFDVFRERLAAMRARGGIASALVFKNVGAAAGASIEHAHSQILATREPTYEPAVEWSLSRDYYEREGVSPFGRMIDEETAAGVRVIERSRFAVVVCPFASRFPYEMWVLPRGPQTSGTQSHFAGCSDDALSAVATLTRRAIARLERVLDRPAYNFVVHTAPLRSPEAIHYDWHVEIYPRIASWAGFEVGGGCYINPVAPERAAERLRGALLEN